MSKQYTLGILSTHPIQYYTPWYRALSEHPDIALKVFYCHEQTPEGQADAGFGVSFDWDIPLFEGYECSFLKNVSKEPNVFGFFGCDTPEIADVIREGRFDAFIVHGWYTKSFWQAIRACWKTDTPVLVRGDSQLLTERSVLRRIAKYPIYRWFIPRFDAYLVVGSRSSEYYRYYGADSQKMFPVPHCVDNKLFGTNDELHVERKYELRDKWDIPRDNTVFLFVGKLVEDKRPEDFLNALKIAYSSNGGVSGLVVGDGPLRSELEETVNKSGVPIVFTGFLNQGEIPDSYVAADVLVVPSASETWGLVVNEAMACGLPAVVSDRVGCAPDLVQPGGTGYIYRCGDVDGLSCIMLDLSRNPERLTEMRTNALSLIRDFSIEAAVSGTLRAIESVNKKQPM